MKKGLFISVLMLSFLFLLAACGTSQETTSGEGSESGETEEKKTLRVVTDAAYAPFEYQDKGEIVGFDVDFIEAVAEEAGYEIEIDMLAGILYSLRLKMRLRILGYLLLQ